MSERPAAPPRRIRKLSWRQAELAALDFEATGLDFEHDEIISFGIVPVLSGRIDLSESVYEVTSPSVPPSPASVTIHGLRAQDLADARPIAETRLALADGIRGRFLLTWYAPVENGFLRKVFGGSRRTWERRNLDVRLLAIAADGVAREPSTSYALSDVAERYRVPVANAHHALDDALVTAELFLVLATTLAENGSTRVRDLFRIAAAGGSTSSAG
jgi:DNA polymerase III subunit epsilon